MGDLESLLELQRLDQAHDELHARQRSLHGDGDQLRAKLAAEQETVAAKRRSIDELERDCRLRTLEVDQLDGDIRDYQRRLDVDIMSYKEMESLREKIVQQRARMSALEDEALEMMDRVEEEKAQLKAAADALERRTEELTAAVEATSRRIRDVIAEIEANTVARGECAEHIPPHLLRRYEQLHGAHRDPIAQIRDGSCSGCNLRVSGSTVERARGGQEIVTCENCSRLLYVAPS